MHVSSTTGRTTWQDYLARQPDSLTLVESFDYPGGKLIQSAQCGDAQSFIAHERRHLILLGKNLPSSYSEVSRWRDISG